MPGVKVASSVSEKVEKSEGFSSMAAGGGAEEEEEEGASSALARYDCSKAPDLERFLNLSR